MRIKSLRLENYRRYREAFLEFPDGVIAIVGPNGSGKSTLLEAITWCLFGHDAARTGKDLIKRSAAPPGEDAAVRVEFELDGDAYVVTRRMRGKTLQADATVDCNGHAQVTSGANSSDQATQYVARLLGMDHRAFHATVVAKQGDLNALSDRTGGARKKLILGMLGVDDVENAIRLVRARKRETTIRVEEVRRALAREPELRDRGKALEEQRANATVELVRWDEALVTHRKRHAGALEALTRLERGTEAYRQLRGRLDGLQRGLDALHAQRVRVGAELQLLGQKRGQLDRLTAERERFVGHEARWDSMERDRASFEERRRLEAQLDRIEAERARWVARASSDPLDEAADGESHEVRRRVEGLAEDAARLEARGHEAQEELRRIQVEATADQDHWRTLRELGPEAPCPTCERPLGDAAEALAHRAAQHQEHVRRRLEDLRSELAGLQERLGKARESRDDLRKELGRLEEEARERRLRAERARMARVELDRIAKERRQAEETLAAAPKSDWDPRTMERLRLERDERDRWSESVARLQESLQRIPRLQEELATLAAQEERQRTEIMEASKELASLDYVEGSAEAARRGLEAERDRVHEADRETARLRERLASLEEGRLAARRDLAHLDTLREQRTTLEEALDLQEHLAADYGEKGILPDFKNHLIARIRPALARAAAQLVGEMTGGRFTDLEFDDEYAVRLYDGAAAWPLERFSGGESDVVNLAVRLAVSELVARARRTFRLQFVALDEVLANQDEQRRRSVLGALKGLSSHFRQVFLVTHWDEVRDGVDNVVRVEPDAAGSSRVWASWSDGAPPARVPIAARIA